MAMTLKLLGAAIVIGGAVTFALWSGRPASDARTKHRQDPTHLAEAADEATGTSESDIPTPPARASRDVPRRAAEAQDEPALMARLRQLANTDPEAALALALDGEARFPDSSAAAERSYWSIRALVNLKDFHEARDQANVMKLKYPGTPWTLEVERHLLVYPLDMPSREEMQAAAAAETD